MSRALGDLVPGLVACGLVACGLVACGLVACTPAPVDAPLLRIEAIEPVQITPETPLEITGSGFDPGGRGLLQLDGTFHRPGLDPQAVHFETRADAVSEEGVEAALDPGVLRALGRGTFRGEARLVFEAHDGKGTISGQLSAVVLDVSAGASSGLERASDEGAAELARWGIEPAEGATDEGVLVASATQWAARAGIAEGDRIIDYRGVRVHSLTDVRAQGDARVALRIERSGLGAPLTLSLERGEPTPTATLPWQPIALALFLLLALGLPARALGAWALGFRAAWHHTRGPMLAQIALAAFCAAACSGWAKGVVGIAFASLVLRIFLSPRPWRDAARFLPVIAALVAAQIVYGPSDVALEGWILVRHPEAVAPMLVAFAASLDGTQARRPIERWLGAASRAAAAAAIALTFGASGGPLSIALAALLAASAAPVPGTWRRPLAGLAVVAALGCAETAGVQLPTAPGIESTWVLAACAAAALLALYATRQRPLRLPYGL